MNTKLYLVLFYVFLEKCLVIDSAWGPNSYCAKREIIPKVSLLNVHSNVSNNYATTVVTTTFKNVVHKPQQATFSLILPEAAFISKFSMEIDGRNYQGFVIKKTENITDFNSYNTSIVNGLNSSLAGVHARDSSKFSVSITVEPKKNVTVHLTYEEFVQKTNAQYELVYNINPGQTVDHLKVQVHIDEMKPLKFVRSPAIRTGNQIVQYVDNATLPKPDITLSNSNKSAVVRFHPDIERQQQLACSMGGNDQDGIFGQFLVQYDVDDSQNMDGEILVKNNYFVQYFAPGNLSVLPKLVTFVLDVSGSMDGVRLDQLKEAMHTILNELRPVDTFNLLTFSYDAYMCNFQQLDCRIPANINADSLDVNAINLYKARDAIRGLYAEGGTNIDAALKMGLELVKEQMSKFRSSNSYYQPITILLSDGEATVGQTDPDVIANEYLNLRKNIQFINPLYCLSFGDGADKTLMNKLSEKNEGFSKHIYDGKDAPEQLEGFYRLISSPLLSNITFRYGSQNLSRITKTNFPLYFNGTELVVTGKTDQVFSAPTIIGWGQNGPVEFVPKIYRPIGDLERQWAFITLKQMLNERKVTTSDGDREELTEKIIQIALKYNFVTNFTALIVVDPNGTRPLELEDASSAIISEVNSNRTCSAFIVPKPEVIEMKICTTVSNRFASTLVTSNVTNPAEIAQDTTFHMALPESAFITGFLMIVDGHTYKSTIKDTSTTSDMYYRATAVRKEQAFLFDGQQFDGSNFELTVSLKPNKTAYFRIVYQEFLQRKDGRYTIRVPVSTRQLVNKLHVTMKIEEFNPILTNLTVPPLKGSEEEPQLVVGYGKAFIKFDADLEKQRDLACSLGMEPEDGLVTEVSAQYDIEREPDYNPMLVRDDYFLYFFGPREIPLKKQVVFLMDVSLSMQGDKFDYSVRFLQNMLSEIDKSDMFNLVTFASEAKIWSPTSKKLKPSLKNWIVYDNSITKTPPPFKVIKRVIISAVKDYGILQPDGDKDLKSGLELAYKLLTKGEGLFQPIIVIVTDGENTKDNFQTLIALVGNGSDVKSSIFALNLDGSKKPNAELSTLCQLTSGETYDVDLNNLQSTLPNSEEMYKKFSLKKFHSLKFKHGSAILSQLTVDEFPEFTIGDEIVLSGQYSGSFDQLSQTSMSVTGSKISRDFYPRIEISPENLDRIWAYLMLRNILDKMKLLNNHNGLTQHAERLANQYAFFSRVNAMAVTLDAACETNTRTVVNDVCVFNIQPKPFWLVTKQDDFGNHLCLTQTNECCFDTIDDDLEPIVLPPST